MTIMALDTIDDWAQRLARQDAFWERAIIDRPVVHMAWGEPRLAEPTAPADHRTRWLDAAYQAERARVRVANTRYAGDALPSAWPNLGPEVFSAYFGMEMEYGERTSWSIPNLTDWAEVDRVRFRTDNAYWLQTQAMTEALLEVGRGLFYTGYTDIHPGADAIAAFRDPEELNCDLIEHPEAVLALRQRVDDTFCQVFADACDRLQAAGQAITSWPGIVSSRRWHVPSCDFSCMISTDHFERFFLPGIIRECEAAEASLYHLDGPDALRHLDALLSIEALDAVQWVYGAGHGRCSDWLEVYRRVQAAGKGLQIARVQVDELETLCTALRPEGVWLSVAGISDADAAQAVIDRVSAWTGRCQVAV